jgi:hypothetical protein
MRRGKGNALRGRQRRPQLVEILPQEFDCDPAFLGAAGRGVAAIARCACGVQRAERNWLLGQRESQLGARGEFVE